MKDILIYGFGGFGHEVACILHHINKEVPTWNVIGYIDDGVEKGTECRYGKVLGNIDTLNAWAGGANRIYYLCVGLHGINFLIELGVNLILSSAIVRIIKVGKKQ